MRLYLKTRGWAFWVNAAILLYAVANLATMHFTGHQLFGADADLIDALIWGPVAVIFLFLYVREARRLT